MQWTMLFRYAGHPKRFPDGKWISQLTLWVKMRKEVLESLSGIPTVKAIQRGCKRINYSNSYSEEHKKKLRDAEDLRV